MFIQILWTGSNNCSPKNRIVNTIFQIEVGFNGMTHIPIPFAYSPKMSNKINKQNK